MSPYANILAYDIETDSKMNIIQCITMCKRQSFVIISCVVPYDAYMYTVLKCAVMEDKRGPEIITRPQRTHEARKESYVKLVMHLSRFSVQLCSFL